MCFDIPTWKTIDLGKNKGSISNFYIFSTQPQNLSKKLMSYLDGKLEKNSTQKTFIIHTFNYYFNFFFHSLHVFLIISIIFSPYSLPQKPNSIFFRIPCINNSSWHAHFHTIRSFIIFLTQIWGRPMSKHCFLNPIFTLINYKCVTHCHPLITLQVCYVCV